MDRLITTVENRLRRAWLATLEHLRDEHTISDITARISRGHHDVVEGIEAAAAAFAAQVHAGYVTSGQAAARWLGQQFAKSVLFPEQMTVRIVSVDKKLAGFDAADPASVRWAQRNRLDLIREITNEQREAIRHIQVAAARSGANPRETARQIRDSIGLTRYQAGVVERYRQELQSGQLSAAMSRELRDGRHDRTLQAAMRDGKTLTPAQIDTMTERYRANWVAYRAENIARTEGLRASHQGTEAAYAQAVERGDIEAAQVQRKWNHSPGAKNKKNERLFHKSMAGQLRGFGEAFVSGLGNELRYPGDPAAPPEETLNCRCAISTRLLPPSKPRASRPPAAAPAPAPAAGSESPPPAPPVFAPPPRSTPTPTPAEVAAARQQQQLQQAQQRLAERQAALDAVRADAERIAAEHAAAEAEVAQLESGFRIGVTSEITGSEGDDVVPALAGPLPAIGPVPRDPVVPDALGGDPFRTPGDTGTDVVPTGKPAPVGYEAVDYHGRTLYRHRITGRSYTAAQVEARQNASYHFEVTGPEAGKVPGFDTLETKEPHMASGELRYRSQASGTVYTADQVATGEAVELERWLVDFEAKEQQRPGFLSRLASLLTGKKPNSRTR